MNTSLVSSQAVDLLSRITGQKLTQSLITPSVTFLANLVTVLLGVIFVDGTVAEEEKQKLLTILYRFSTPESDIRRLTHLMIKGIKENQIYRQINNLLILSDSLSESEKLLIIAYGYEISAIDGIGLSEKQYLEILGKHININPKYLSVLESAFAHNNHTDYVALDEVRCKLDPCRFSELDIVFVNAASDILVALPTKPEITITQHNQVAYSELKKYQENQKELDSLCHRVLQVVEDCNARGFLHSTLIDEVGAAVLIPAFVFAGPILAVIGGLIGGGLLGSGLGGVLGIDLEIKSKVFDTGCQQFVNSLDIIFDNINEIISTAFNEKTMQSEKIIHDGICFYEKILDQYTKVHQETLIQCQADKAWICQKRQDLEQLNNQIEAIR